MAMDLGGGSGRKGVPRPTMNVTPLVDVVLVLLIIFMVITPLLSKQFWVNLPHQEERARPATPEPQDDSKAPVLLSVDAQGVIRINSDVVPKAELARKVTRVLAARGDRTLFFDAADDADFALAVEAMDIARGGGATTIAVLTDRLGR